MANRPRTELANAYRSRGLSYGGGARGGYRGVSPGSRGVSPGYRGVSPGYRGVSPGYRGGYRGYSGGYRGYPAYRGGYRGYTGGYRGYSGGGYRGSSGGGYVHRVRYVHVLRQLRYRERVRLLTAPFAQRVPSAHVNRHSTL